MHVKLILVLVAQLMLLRRQVQAAEFRSFRCEQPDKINETLAGVKQMTIHGDRIYMIFKHKVVNFLIPISFIGHDGRRYFVNGPVWEQQADYVEPDASNRSLGYLQLYDSSKTMEIIHTADRNLSVTPLDFSGAIPKRSEKLWELNESLPFDYRRFFDGKKDDYMRTMFLYIFVSKPPEMKTLFFEYLKNNTLSIGVANNQLSSDMDSSSGQRPYHIDYGFFYEYHKDERLFNNRSMIEFDLSEQSYHIKLISYRKLGESDEMFRFLTANESEEIILPMTNLLDCPRPHVTLDEVKGIYHDTQLKSFFIFINHYYLQIREDLVENGFKLFGRGDLMQYAKMFEFERYEDAKSVLYDSWTKNWVRSAGMNETQLILFGQTFFLSAKNDGLVIVKRAPNPAILKCHYQTLILKGRVFCFENEYYYLINETFRLFQIRLMFAKTAINYTNIQRVQFVFNYMDDKFVLMTLSNLYVIDYSWVNFDESELSLNIEPNEDLVERKNCFFQPCEEPTSSATTEITPISRLTVPTEKKNEFVQWLKSSYQFVIVAAVLLALVIAFLLLQSARNKEHDRDTNSPSLIKMSNLEEDKNDGKPDDRGGEKSASNSDKSRSDSKTDGKRNEMDEEYVQELVQIPDLNRIEPASS